MRLPRWLRWRTEGEIEEELQAHLDEEVQGQIDRGVGPQEAERAARRTLGNLTLLREKLREADPLFQVETVWLDIRYAARRIVQTPLISLGVLLTLTLGIGVNTSVFTFVNGFLFRPRVSKDPDSFAHIVAAPRNGTTNSQRRAGPRGAMSSAEYEALLRTRSFSSVTARSQIFPISPTSLAGGYMVSCNYIDAHYDRPILGRSLEAHDCTPSAAPVAVMTERYWRSTFLSDRHVLGKTIEAGKERLTIIGVVKDEMVMGDERVSIFVPLTVRGVRGEGAPHGDTPWLDVMARLKPGVSRGNAQAEADVIAASFGLRLRVTSGAMAEDMWNTPLFRTLATMFGLIALACGLLYLLVCANVTALLLARAATRRQEMAVRVSLGAGRGRLVRQLLTESGLLAMCAASASLWIAATLPEKVLSLNAPSETFQVDWRVFAFNFGIAALAGCAAGLSPALESLRPNLSATLRPLRHGGRGPGHSKVRNAIMATQMAVSAVAVIFTSLLVMAQYQIRDGGFGYDPESVLVYQPHPRRVGEAGRQAYTRNALEALNNAPGIAAVGAAVQRPFSDVRVEVQTRDGGPPQSISWRAVSLSYFDVFGIRVLRGRLFTAGEARQEENPVPVVVSQAFVRQIWSDREPIGRLLELTRVGEAVVVGVSSDTSSVMKGELDGPLIYLPARDQFNAIVIRAAGDPALAVRTIRERLPDGGDIPTSVATLIERQTAGQAAMTISLMLPAGAVLFLALIGIYGVVSYSVTQRVHEIGLRLALGAQRSDIAVLFLRSVRWPLAMGLVFGSVVTVAAAYAFGQVQRTSGFDPLNPLAFSAGILVVAGEALLATCVPTYLAARLDPLRTLRDE